MLDSLKSKAQFQSVFEARQRLSDSFFTLYFILLDQPACRLGMVVSKRNVKRAVDRNYLKRIIREHFRLNPVKLSGFDFVIVIKPAVMSANKDQLHTCLKKLIQRVNQL